MMKKVFALLVALMMVLSMGTSAFAAARDVQVVNVGGTVWYNSNDAKLTSGGVLGENAVVEMSKTIAGTDVENEFEVTLQVKTTAKLTEIATDTPNAAVMLVIDTSGSMDYCVHCGKTENHENHSGTTTTTTYCSDGAVYKEAWCPEHRRSHCVNCHKSERAHNVVTTTTEGKCAYTSRLTRAKEAAVDFLDQFANETGAKGDDKRMAMVVEFATDANRLLTNWVDLRAADGTGMAAAQAVFGNSLDAEGGTNIEAGLSLAGNIIAADLEDDGAIAGYDYVYTVLLTDGNPTYYAKSSPSTTTVSRDDSDDDDWDTGSTTDRLDADVWDEAAAIRTQTNASKLYSICFGTNENDIDVFNTTPFGDWNYDDTYKTTSSTTVGGWLGMFSDAAFNGGQDNLFAAFDSIADMIAVGSKAWRVTDTMGDNITYEGSVPVQNATGGALLNRVDTTTTNGRTSFVWNILQSSYDPSITTAKFDQSGTMLTGVIGYTYKYKVKLDNLNGYVAGTDNNANQSATLKYMLADAAGNWPTSESALKDGTFLVPVVKGMKAGVLTKVGLDGAALEGASFKAVHASDCACGMAKADTSYEWTATSNENGEIAFTNLPSGHKYTLTETAAPEGYSTPTTAQTIYVDYGTVKSGSKTGAALTQIANTPLTQSLTITKVLGENSAAVTLSDDITFTVKNSAGETVGTVTYAQIKAGNGTISNLTPGTYTVTESNADIAGYTLTTKVGSENVTANKTASVAVPVGAGGSIEFENTYTRDVGYIKVKKTFTGEAEAIPASIQANVKNAAGEVVDTLTLSAPTWEAISKALPVGTYSVEEVNAEVDGYILTATAAKDVKVTKGATTNAEIVNKYTKNTTINKTSTSSDGGLTTYPAPTIVLTKDGVETKVALAANGSASVALVPGTYTVTEIVDTVDYYTPTVSVKINDGTETKNINLGGNFTVEAGKSYTIDVTNTYVREDTEFIEFDLTKKVTFDEVDPGKTTFTFNMTAAIERNTATFALQNAIDDGKVVVMYNGEAVTAKDGSYTLTLEADAAGATGKVQIYANADDMEYLKVTITEVSAGKDWAENTQSFVVTAKYNKDKGVWEAVLPTDGVVFNNHYKVMMPRLTLNKVITGLVSTDSAYPTSIDFAINRINDAGEVTEERIVTLYASENWTKTIADLEPGKYTVTEEVVDPDYYNVSTKVDGAAGTSKTVTVGYDDVVTVNYENIYTQTDAKMLFMNIHKDVKQGLIAAPETTFTFEVTLGYDKADNGVATMNLVAPKTATVRAGGTAYTGNLEEGITFTTTITTNGANEEGYNRTLWIEANEEDLEGLYLTVTEVNDGASYWIYDSNATQKLPVEKDKTAYEFFFTNEYNEGYITKQIPVSKTVVQSGNIEPGVNTFYFDIVQAFEEVDFDELEKANKWPTIEVTGDTVVTHNEGTFALTVNGADTVSAQIKITYPESVPMIGIYVYEMAGIDESVTIEELAAKGWIYDKTANFKINEYGWPEHEYYWRYFFEDDRVVTPDLEEGEEINFVNTYTASTPPPQTGDNSNVALWLALMAISALGFVVISKRRSA